jgi:hypothetical protein
MSRDVRVGGESWLSQANKAEVRAQLATKPASSRMWEACHIVGVRLAKERAGRGPRHDDHSAESAQNTAQAVWLRSVLLARMGCTLGPPVLPGWANPRR